MSTSSRPAVTPQAVVGVSICLMGIALTLDNFGILQLRSFVDLWPVVPISIGVLTLMYGQSKQDYVKGTLWLAVGMFFTFRHTVIREVWPILLVALGGYLVWRSRTAPPPARRWDESVVHAEGTYVPYEPSPPSPPPTPGVPTDVPPPIPESHQHTHTKTGPFGCGRKRHFGPGHSHGHSHDAPASSFTSESGTTSGEPHEFSFAGFPPARGPRRRGQRPALFALMSGVRRQVKGIFSGAEATAIMGGVELDLRSSVMDGDEVIIDTFALWGGIEVWVPQHWEIVSQGLPLMGSFEDKTHLVQQPRQPRLIIRGVAVMGSVEVKN